MVANSLNSPHISELLDSLFEQADASEPALEAVAQSDASRLLKSRTGFRELYQLLEDIPIPVSRETGQLLYVLVRSTRARNVIEFGTSFGISTIYLAAALRDNGGGRVITTELLPSKAARARENLTRAGLIDLVEIREGDARETLAQDLPRSLDILLLDGAKALYGDVLQCVQRCLRPGSLILADDAQHCPELVSLMRSDANGYLSVPLAGDLELAMHL
jgi:predicted O-methyltransferase YrrM